MSHRVSVSSDIQDLDSARYCFLPVLPCVRSRRTSVPIRPRSGSEFPTLESGNNAGTIRVPFCSLTRFSVPSGARKSLKFQIKMLCHGRGREFESRRPRHISQLLREIWLLFDCTLFAHKLPNSVFLNPPHVFSLDHFGNTLNLISSLFEGVRRNPELQLAPSLAE